MFDKIDWKKSPPHLLFLSTFLVPRSPTEHPTDNNWELLLVDPENVIEQFKRDGAIRDCPLSALLSDKFTVEELKQMVRKRQLPITNQDRKIDLVNKLVQYDEFGMWEAVDDVELLQCTDFGYQLVEAFLKNPELVEQELSATRKNYLTKVIQFILAAAAGGVIENVAWQGITEYLQKLLPILRELLYTFSTYSQAGLTTDSIQSKVKVLIEDIETAISMTKKLKIKVELLNNLESSKKHALELYSQLGAFPVDFDYVELSINEMNLLLNTAREEVYVLLFRKDFAPQVIEDLKITIDTACTTIARLESEAQEMYGLISGLGSESGEEQLSHGSSNKSI